MRSESYRRSIIRAGTLRKASGTRMVWAPTPGAIGTRTAGRAEDVSVRIGEYGALV